MPDTSDGSSEMLHERLERARAAGNVAEQVDILRRLAAVAPSPDGRADYLAHADVLAYFDLEDDSLSLQLLDEAVAQDSTVLERHFEAVSAWETLCRANDRSDALLAVHDLRIKGATDASMQAVHRLVKAGFLMHELGDPLAAAAEAELVLARDPVHVPALQLLAEALTAAGEPEQAWPVWLRLLQPGVLDDVERPGVLEQAAWFATDFGRAEALELWWAVLETSPSNLVAYQQLRRLTEGQPTRRWLVVEQECAATLGVERSGVLRTLMQLNWGSLPESLQIHLQTLTAELLELRLDHNERLAWPWRAVLESLLRAPAVHPAAWATAARLAMAAQWDELSEALWDGVAVWAIDPDLLALARNRGIAPASEHTSSTPTITHEIPMAAPSDQWPATPSKRATPVRAGATITYDAPMPERLADQPLDPARRADQARQAGGTETIVHEVPMARPPADWEVVDTNDVETATQADISSTDAPGHRRPATITHDVPMARRSNDWEAAPTDQTTDVIADTGADTAPVAPTSPPRATGSPSLAGAETARALAASIPSARIDQARPAPSAAAVSADSNDGSFNKELARLDAVAAVDRTAALRDLERVLRTTRAPAERVELLMRKGEWLVALGRGEEALQPLKGAFIYQAQNPNLRALLALAFAASGKTNDARSHARAALTRADALRFDPHALRRLAGLGD